MYGPISDLYRRLFLRLTCQVKFDINKQLSECKKQLQSLGPCRETRDQQHEYLLNLATRFQTLTLHALAARYGADSLFDRFSDLRLATAVVSRNETFADDIWKKGHAMTFSQGSEASENSDDQDEDDDAEEDEDADNHGLIPDDALEYTNGQQFTVRYTGSDPDLEDILHHDCSVPMPKPNGIIPWLEHVYKNSRGFELGTFDASLLSVVWKKQSEHWDDLALGFVSDIVSLVHKFIYALISAICDDQRVQSALRSTLMDALADRYAKSIDHAKFVISVEKDDTPQTLNHYFADSLEK